MRMVRMRAVEFYSGIGGLHWAFKSVLPEGQVVAAFDINEVANDVYQHNFGFRPHQGNIQGVPLKRIDDLKADIWLLSPPCQPYTRQGLKKDANDGRASSFLNLLEKLFAMEHPPKYLLLENVVGFETSITRGRMMGVLQEGGFTVQEFIISPNQLGIPYSRPRYFCLAKNNGCFPLELPAPNHTWRFPPSVLQGDSPEKMPEVRPLRDFLDDQDCLDLGGPLPESADTSLEVPAKVLERCCDVVNVVIPEYKASNCFTKSYAKYVKGTGAVLATEETHLLPRVEKLQDFCCNNRASGLDHWDVSATVCNGQSESDPPEASSSSSSAPSSGERLVEGSEVRTAALKELHAMTRAMNLRYFSPREVSRLHAFPKDFSFPEHVTLKQRYALLGNSLCVNVVADLLRWLI
ncbi:hypothetical protein BSKO_11508 [Bryopsis sp. KO-2023]|nr:hypothetical protein BSKO_11508 [Bryopsis sp. KO-2023]